MNTEIRGSAWSDRYQPCCTNVSVYHLMLSASTVSSSSSLAFRWCSHLPVCWLAYLHSVRDGNRRSFRFGSASLVKPPFTAITTIQTIYGLVLAYVNNTMPIVWSSALTKT